MANNDQVLDCTFAALADPTRRAIVARLCQGEAPVGELARPFSIGLPTLLKHIRVLEDGGLVTTRKAGRVRTCTLVPDVLRCADAWLRAHIDVWESRLDRLEAHLHQLKKKDLR
ncbi:metalloregulator ArsR/SmtB family transcription factor [Calidifontimicrobium sp. SYSU G02091]|nr:metalloregulator ArsR/SmtB family transcription factor [Calidifontimicrobium sp. SYSU G02091]MCI1193829.1 metalloregulator ArsR/SmtB family transcription factor [Calidifontimicrobium sp. SYSU G02091]